MLANFYYSDKEVDTLVKSLVILIDTREQVNEHITNVYDKRNIPYKKRALKYGDYSFMIPANEALNIPRDLYYDNEIVVERKASLEELSGNLTQDRGRFEKELSLAPKTKVLLVEDASYEDIAAGKYSTEYNRKSFLGSLHTYWFRYNIPVFFMSDKKYSALFIRNYFEYYMKERLR